MTGSGHDADARPAPPDPPFRALRQLNCPEGRRDAGLRHRLTPTWPRWFTGASLPDRLARALAARGAVDMKELAEAFEFFARVRRAVRRPVVADLCAGHGLVGLLFALFERGVEQVLLVDRQVPPAAAAIRAAFREVGPWVDAKVRWHALPLAEAAGVVPVGAGVVGVHACGAATDACLDVGLAARGPIAVMPCCHGRSHTAAPPAVLAGLGRALATDVHRTYRLTAAGYDVRWTAIPRCITPRNLILEARLRPAQGAR
ncbi:MAG: hypothetical protein H6706_01270 [Myxococcales bacterium]|nr:hypothetical protein [Myxococcales bacterium]